jgi:hypothetical protein
MTKSESQNFLAQFAASRKAFDAWPVWMRQSATVAAATFPRQDAPEKRTEQNKSVPSSSKKAV